MSEKKQTILVSVGILVALILVISGTLLIKNNKAINLEEQIESSNSNINKEEKRRLDLFNNLADAVKSYNNYESGTLEKVTEARSKAEGGNVTEAVNTLNAVAESYPELKSSDNYQDIMTEFSITENRVANYRENYNDQVRSYKKYIRQQPTRLILKITGYQFKNYKYIQFDVYESSYKNLFGN